jgi:GNAT superfamily N-acetyltransferase
MLPHVVRPYKSISDESFLYATWIKSYHVPRCPAPFYLRGQREVINNILKDPNTNVLVAADQETQELIYGYIVTNANNVHYVYVKGPYRGNGIATSLLSSLEDGPVLYSHRPPISWLADKLESQLRFIFDPYLLLIR